VAKTSKGIYAKSPGQGKTNAWTKTVGRPKTVTWKGALPSTNGAKAFNPKPYKS
jgi:hypothetical protein